MVGRLVFILGCQGVQVEITHRKIIFNPGPTMIAMLVYQGVQCVFVWPKCWYVKKKIPMKMDQDLTKPWGCWQYDLHFGGDEGHPKPSSSDVRWARIPKETFGTNIHPKKKRWWNEGKHLHIYISNLPRQGLDWKTLHRKIPATPSPRISQAHLPLLGTLLSGMPSACLIFTVYSFFWLKRGSHESWLFTP